MSSSSDESAAGGFLGLAADFFTVVAFGAALDFAGGGFDSNSSSLESGCILAFGADFLGGGFFAATKSSSSLACVVRGTGVSFEWVEGKVQATHRLASICAKVRHTPSLAPLCCCHEVADAGHTKVDASVDARVETRVDVRAHKGGCEGGLSTFRFAEDALAETPLAAVFVTLPPSSLCSFAASSCGRRPYCSNQREAISLSGRCLCRLS